MVIEACDGIECAMDSGEDLRLLMTKRLAVYLPDPILEKLEKWANDERRSASNLAAFLLELAVREHEAKSQDSNPSNS